MGERGVLNAQGALDARVGEPEWEDFYADGELLAYFTERFDLKLRYIEGEPRFSATGRKLRYYSKYDALPNDDWRPRYSSLSAVAEEAAIVLKTVH